MSKYHIALAGIFAITTIVCCCIIKGIDGTIIAGGCGIVGTIVGYCFAKEKK